ncbi:unnamed protein product [Amoebophrya sp. A120]|nr:unnamed protein product [Amoebophrya sp. A120]|eukprot:GSA120T00022774001.1
MLSSPRGRLLHDLAILSNEFYRLRCTCVCDVEDVVHATSRTIIDDCFTRSRVAFSNYASACAYTYSVVITLHFLIGQLSIRYVTLGSLEQEHVVEPHEVDRYDRTRICEQVLTSRSCKLYRRRCQEWRTLWRAQMDMEVEQSRRLEQ